MKTNTLEQSFLHADELPLYRIDKIEDGLIFYTRYFGEITLDVLLNSSNERTGDPQYQNAVFVVTDMQDADLSRLTADDVRAMGARVREVLKVKPHLVVIMVADAPLAYGLSRLWYGVTKSASDDLYVVNSEDAAMEIISRIRAKRKL